jgi:uridylate kinase
MEKNRVDGVYDSDPRKNPEARKLESLTYLDAINRELKVMDSTALTMCMDNNMPIVVFSLQDDNLLRLVAGEHIGTVIRNEG